MPVHWGFLHLNKIHNVISGEAVKGVRLPILDNFTDMDFGLTRLPLTRKEEGSHLRDLHRITFGTFVPRFCYNVPRYTVEQTRFMDGDHYSSVISGTSTSISREEVIKELFHNSFSNEEILATLAVKHGIHISCRQLGRIMSKLDLRRRKTYRIPAVTAAIQNEIDGPGLTSGYRSMQKRLFSRYGLTVPRDVVYYIQKILDPEGVTGRRNRRLRRRSYYNHGPNFLLHIDGYDKLKRFGFAIHGAIDGFSRRLLWLKVGRTNNDPKIVATFFVDYLESIQGAPRCIRIDAGTENVLIEDIQRAFRLDHNDDLASRSVIMGPSTSNQRIERYWRNNRESGSQFWMDFFKSLEDSGQLDIGSHLHVECLRFCFTELIQVDLNSQRMEWNQHNIRPSSNTQCCSGKPDLMFFAPELYGAVDYKTAVSDRDIKAVREEFCHSPSLDGCTIEFSDRCQRLTSLRGRNKPSSYQEALDLFIWLSSRMY